MKRLFLLFCLTAAFASQAQTWLGTVNTDWNTPGNWQGGTVPASNTTATFDGTGVNNCVITGAIAAGGINMATGYTGTISISAGSSITLGGSGFVQAAGIFNCGSGAFTVGNTSNFNCTGGTFIASGNTTTLGNNVNFQRSFQHNNGTLVLNSSSGTTTFSVNGGLVDTVTLYNLTINMGGAATNSYTVAANNKAIVTNTLHIIQGCLDGAVSGTDTSCVILLGNFMDDQVGISNNLASTIDLIFAGSANTTITMASGGEGLYDGRMTINKSTAVNTVTLNSPMILNNTNNQVSFISGKLVTTGTNIFTVGINGINLVNASNNSFVDGPMNKIGGGTPSNAFVFPIGDNGVYAPLVISGSASGFADYAAPLAHTFQAEYFRSDPDPVYSTASRDATLANIGRCEYWRLDKIADLNGTSAPYVWLSYDNVRSCGISAPASLRVSKWDATATPAAKWIDLGANAAVVVNGVSYLPTSAAVAGFSPFNLASTDANANPLPLTITKFAGNVKGEDVLLNWTTASEINISSFTVERSSDGISFETLGNIKAANAAASLQDYQYSDKGLVAGRYYYRLQVNGLDGDITYSKVISVQVKGSTNGLSVYPNPALAGQPILLGIPGWTNKTVHAVLTSPDGRILSTQEVTFDPAGVASFDVKENIASGIYFLIVGTTNGYYRATLCVK